MSESARIDDQLRRSFEGEAWHGPSVREVLQGVSAETARERPLTRAHTIWEIVLHLTGTQELVLRRFDGDSRPLTPEEDWPPVTDSSASAWEEALASLERTYTELRQRIRETPDSRLDEPILPEHSSVYVTLLGLVQHNLYHAGQIALLKKACDESPGPGDAA